MLARRPWIEDLQNFNIRNDFQALVTNFMSLHDMFCKEKNRGNFLDIADTCEVIIALLENPAPPDATAIANSFNNLTTQMLLIQGKKQGQENQELFNRLNNEITKSVTKLPLTILEGIRIYKPQMQIIIGAETEGYSTKKIRQGLTSIWTAEEMSQFINSLRELPPDKTNVINRMAKKHPYLSGVGLFNFAAASGALVQTGTNVLFNMWKSGVEHAACDTNVTVPIVLTVAAVALLGAAYVKSRPAVRPILQSDEERDSLSDDGMRTRLLKG
jgi:hypothetical protein